ncbi:MAG: S8 family serine peptidase [Candidatus Latescibacteria bacterium]|nr:S8 family serine peptidase [Candidatus Latescibacterota bacterium]
MKRILTFSLLTYFFCAGAYAETRPYWIFFKDRGDIDVESVIAAKIVSPSEPKNSGRRARLYDKARLFDETDVPVNPDYIARILETGCNFRTVSRYFNSVSVEIDDTALETVRTLTFVRAVEPVSRFRKPAKPVMRKSEIREKPASLEYGASLAQLNSVGVVPLHALGYMGKGILIAVLDSGFENLGHPAFDSLTVSHKWDFVENDTNVDDDDHGAEVLSIIAALDHGAMIGAAPYATYILARTEIVEGDDIREEEDYWIAGIEWADSLGADIVNSSLGYSEFDDSSYSYADMDGKTAKTTIAADIAVEHGVVVVTSAGNEGDTPWYYITSPADGFNVISVGSVDRGNNISSFSSRGPTFDGRIKPEFVTLGELVWTVNTTTLDSYHYQSGTSFAAPSVSGAVALLLEINPDWSPGMVFNSFIDTAQEAGPDSLYGYGFIDAYDASAINRPYLSISSPTGGEEWNPGQTYTITWNSKNVASISILYSTNNGFSWKQIDSSVNAADGYYDWEVPNDPSNECKIRITDNSGIETVSTSMATFTIRQAVLVFKVYDPYPQPLVYGNVDSNIYFPMDVPVSNETVLIRIFTFSGENIKTIQKNVEQAGGLLDRTEAPSWDAKNYTGDDVAPGIYYYTIELAGFTKHAGKIAVIR